MVESGAPNLPGRQAAVTSSADASRRAQPSVSIRSISDNIVQSRATRIEARVEQVSRDGTVRLESAQGRIEVQVSDPRVLAQLREGQVVQIDIPAPARGDALPRHAEIVVLEPVQNDVPARNYTTPVNVEITVAPLTEAGAGAASDPQAQIVTPQTQHLTPDSNLPAYPVRIEAIGIEQLAAYLPSATPEVFTVDVPNTLHTPAVLAIAPDDVNTLIQGRPDLLQTPQVSITPQNFTPSLESLVQTILSDRSPAAVPPQITLPAFGAVYDLAAPLNTNSNPIQTTVTPVTAEAINFSLLNTPSPQPLTSNIYLTGTQEPLAFVQNAQTTANSAPLALQPVNIYQAADAPLSANVILSGQKAGQLSAVVVGQTPESLPVILGFQANGEPSGFFILHTPFETITAGLQVSLIASEGGTANNTANPSLQPLPILPALPFSFLNAEPWQALNQIQQVLAQVAPQAAQAFSNMIPSMANPAQIVPAALFFMSALRGGNLHDWLGSRNIDILSRAGQSDLVGRLGQEGALLGRAGNEANAQDWRALSLPFLWDNEINKVVLHYKQDRDSDGDQNASQDNTQTRFVFDLSLNAMGAVQIDGLFRPGRLDVILRSESHFSQNMQSEMRRLYADSLRTTQVTGELSFQTQLDGWVTIHPDHTDDGVEV